VAAGANVYNIMDCTWEQALVAAGANVYDIMDCTWEQALVAAGANVYNIMDCTWEQALVAAGANVSARNMVRSGPCSRVHSAAMLPYTLPGGHGA
jgi:hypothetical protein